MTIVPQVAFYLVGMPVNETVVSTWIMMVLLTLAALWLRRTVPGVLDLLVDFVEDSVTVILGRPAAPYVPLLGCLAVFIAAANALGIVPTLVAPTRGINTPVALAVVVFFSVHFFGVREKGLLGYLRSMASPLITLPLELVGQVSRTLSLSLRLFGNVLSGELIVAVIFSLLPLIVPIPLMAFGILTGLLQAYIFTVLAAVYIGSAVAASAE
jgi:F-type H+-transporting ATPase subunit a